MKQFCLLLLIVFGFQNAFSFETLVPSASISGTTTVCKNAASPLITFTGSAGIAPYIFIYKINGGANLTISTTGTNSSVTLSAPTGTAGTFTYSLVSVQDASLPATPVNVSGSVIITVNPQPDATLGGTGSGSTFNGTPVFRICSNAASTFTFTNASATSGTLNTNYTINWGDGSPNFVSNSWTTTTHPYAIGLWNLVYTIQSSNGCNITKNYIVFVGSNPAVSLGNPGNTDICNSSSLTFPITGTTNNPPGTTYTVTFNDSSTPQVFNHPPPPSITHSFLISSCGVTSSDGANSYPNSFSAIIVASNPCNVSSVGVVPIYVSTPPIANFTLPPIGCVNSSICMTNTSTGAYENNGSSTNCNTNPKIIWSISPSTGFTVSSGTVGNDFGSPDPNLWLTGSGTLCLNFSQPGTYTVTIKTGNRCGFDTKVKTICIESPLSPQFTLTNNSGCTPLAVGTNNTTILTNSCPGNPTYQWNVTYASGFCGSSPGNWSYTSGTTATSASPSFNFVTPGTYGVSVSMTNSCGTVTSLVQTVIVKKPPTVSINTIANYCGTANITPVATVTPCAPASSTLTYAWLFPGGTPPNANTLNPGTINYPPSATPYTVSLVVTNECGASNTATQQFSVNTAPVITNTSLNQTICSGSSTTLVTLTANPSTTTFSWTAVATSGITGFTPSGTATIPAQIITTTNSSPGTVTYTITPTVGTCVGATVIYVVNVNPAPTITTQPASSTVCQGGTPTVLSVALSGATGTPQYQWYSNVSPSNSGGTLITGATNTTYNPPSTTVGALYYYCLITLPTGGCSNITSNFATVTISPLPTVATQPTPSQNLCVGITISSPLSVSYTGGNGTATYQWYSNTSNATTGGTLISGATNSTYTPPVYVTATVYYYYVVITLSGNGCGAVTSTSAQVTVYDDPTITTQPLTTQTLCQGATPTTLQVVATGGNGTFSYQWYSNTSNVNSGGLLISGATSSSYIPPTTTVSSLFYYCIISQTATPGCSVTTTTAQVIINAAPTITNQPAASTICLGGTPTVLSVTYTNGVGTPSYQWYSNLSNSNTGGTLISGAINSTYSPPNSPVGTIYYYCIISLPSSGGCSNITSNTADVTINAGATITSHPTPTQSLCVGVTVATPLTVSYSGGTGTASYQWYSNTSNSNSGGTLISGATNASFTPSVFTTTGTFYYYVVVTLSGNGCGPITSNVAEIIIVVDPIINTQPLPNQTICQNVAPSSLTVTVSGGIGTSYSYQWYSNSANNTTSGTLIPGETNATFIPPTANVGTTYNYCIITQALGSGCNVTSATATVIVNLAPAISTQPISSTICIGQTPTLLSVSYVNGVGTSQYQWYSNSTNSTIGSTLIPSATSASYNPPSSTSGTTYYYCVITFSSGGCSNITSNIADVTINQNPVIASQNSIICSGTAFTVTPNNATGDIVPIGTTYTWTNPTISPAGSITGANAESTPQTTISQTLINNTTSPSTVVYTVTPLSGVCAGANFTITVTVNPSITPNTTVLNSTCYASNSGSITTNITGGIPFSSGPPYIISWTGPGGFTSLAANISALAPGVYNLTVTDFGGCPFSNNYTITEPADIVITTDLEKDITCFGAADGEIQLTITGGTTPYAYTWTKNTLPFAITEDITNLGPGVYFVSVTDANSCGPTTATFTITEPPLLVVSLVSQTNVLCFGAATGAITINTVGGTPILISPGVFDYTYSWTGPNGFVSSSQNLNNIQAGTYNLVVTDNSGCIKNLTVTLTQPTEIIITAVTTPITCYGANNASITVTITGGNPAYQIAWSNLALGLYQSNLSAGNYTITVTDATGCQKSLTINIPQAPVFTTNPIVTQITCFGANNGSINLNLTGGIPTLSLVWADGSPSGLIRNNLGPGTYAYTITDGTPCTISGSFTLIEPQLLVLTANVTNALNCNNANTGSINLLVSGGTPPFTYSWSNGAITEDLNNLSAGNYSVIVTDARGCIKTGQYSITSPAPIVLNVTTTTIPNCPSFTITQNFAAQVSGGLPPYQFNWSSGVISGSNNEFMTTNQNGLIVLTATDALGCTANYTFNVTLPILADASFDVNSIGYTNYGEFSIIDPIQFTNTAVGDFTTFLWDFGDGTFSNEENPIHSYVNEGSYVVTQTVTYPFGCTYTHIITLVIKKGYLLVVPTAFTPNNDNLNDTFRPVTKALKDVRMDIYDTWGSLIYSEIGDVLIGWDATIKGVKAENGNYYCKVSGKTFYGTDVYENQTFVLIK